MKYHKKLKREDLLKYGWKNILRMTASELSRAHSLSKNGGGKELEMCFLRAKELFGVLEVDSSLRPATAIKLLPIMRKLSSTTEIEMISISAIDANTAWVVGTSYVGTGVILHATDAGLNWVAQTPEVSVGLGQVSFVH
ncbi:MAG: hypothetical protein U9R38_05045 [Candidatus Margulisiibacteriota bacterium]|nr:hypothetical protein [Candidatus Margulisiibacteriota bacterium]